MTVAAKPATITYAEDGVTLTYAVPFRYQNIDLAVTRRLADGSIETLSNGSGWLATPGPTDDGGTLTLVSTVAGAELTIARATARRQSTDYQTNDRFPAETHELALDRAMMIDQEQDAKLDRAVLVPPGSSGPTFDLTGLLEGDILQYIDGRLQRLNRALFAGKYYGGDATGRLVPLVGAGNDAALRGDLASEFGGDLIAFLQAGLGAIKRTNQGKLREIVSVTDFGAKGDGETDDSAAIQAAINTGKSVFFPKPPVAYRATGLSVSTTGQTLYGEGYISYIQCDSGVLFTVTASQVTIRNLRLRGGYVAGNQAILLDGAGSAQAKLQGLDMREFDVFVRMNGGFHHYMTDCHTRNVRTFGVQLDDGVGMFMSRVTYDTDGGSFSEPSAFIRMRNEGNVISDCDFIHPGTGLLVEPVSRNIEWCLFSNLFIADSGASGGANAGIRILQNSDTFYVRGLLFNQVWSATNNMGILIDGSGAAEVDGIVFNACPIHNNRNESVRITANGTKRITFRNCELVGASAAGGSANNFYANIGDLMLQNNTIGADFRWISVPLHQVYLDTGVAFAVLDGNQFNQLSSGAMLLNNAPPGTVSYGRNFGLFTQNNGSATIAIGTTTAVVDHGLSVTPTPRQIQITPQSGWGSATAWWISNVTSTQFTINVDTTQSGNDFTFNWSANVLTN